MNRLFSFLANFSLIALLAVSTLWAGPPTCQDTAGTVDRDIPEATVGGDFCSAGATENCFGTNASIPLTLELPRDSSSVDVVCTTDVAKLCIMDEGCQEQLGTRIGDNGDTVELVGDFPRTLRLIVVDEDAAICNSGGAALVMCEFGDPDLIFDSSFETHEGDDFSDWTRLRCPRCTATAGLIKSTRARKRGQFGLESSYRFPIRRSRPALLIDGSPDDETRYVVKFAIKPTGSFKMGSKDKHDILRARQQNPIENVLIIRLQPARGGKFRLVVIVREHRANGGLRFRNAGAITIKPKRWTRIDVDWQAASAEGARDGFVRLYRNTVLVKEVENLDTFGLDVDQLLFGQVGGIDRTTRGVIFFENFDSRRFPKSVLGTSAPGSVE